MSGQLSLSNLTTSSLSVDFINSDLIPGELNVYSLGTEFQRFKDLWVSAGTIHVGDAALSERNGGLATDTAMEFGTDASSRVTIGSNAKQAGITIGSSGGTGGTTVFKNSGMSFFDDTGGETVVDNTIFSKVESIAKTEVSTQLTKNSEDFGFLTDYAVGIDNDSSGSNSINSINNGNFEVGKLFNIEDSLNLNTFITSTRTNHFYDFNAAGEVSLFSAVQKLNRLNKRLDKNAINIKLDASEQVLIPIETNTTIRDVFPLNILDMNKKDGRLKFKSDFDNVGSLYYADQSGKLSGLCNLKNYVQLSDPQFASMYYIKDQSINLSKNEYLVDFISFYNLPILFESQLSENLAAYDYFISSLPENRIVNTVYSHDTDNTQNTVEENGVEVSSIKDMSTVTTPVFTRSFYPAIRVIKWKNIYTPSFTKFEADAYDTLKTKLKWGTVEEVYTKYTTGTNTGENWIAKLVELTFAYLKYGRSLKPLISEEMVSVQTILANISDNKSLIKLDTTLLEISIESSAIAPYL